MATILPFVIRPAARAAPRLCSGDAAVVIFPGVRYESSPQASAEALRKREPSAARKRKNKTS